MATTEIVETTDKYAEYVDKACELINRTTEMLLQFYWDLGHIIRNATAGNGKQSVPEFFRRLTQRMPDKINLGLSSMYNALDMANYTPSQLKLAQTCKVPLKHALEIATQPDGVRTELLRQVSSGTLLPKELKDAKKKVGDGGIGIAELSAGGRAETPVQAPKADSKRASTIKVTRAAAGLVAATDRFVGYADAVDVLCGVAIDDEAADEIRKAHAETVDAAEVLKSRIDSELKMAARVIAKTITAGTE